MKTNKSSIARQAFSSVACFMRLTGQRRLHLKKSRLQKPYSINGHTYKIFRETHRENVSGKPNVLVIGFRLHLVKSSRLLNWGFQRLCILTTPFWSGMAGFSTKLWMVNPETKDYLGIYEWRGEKAAVQYINFLMPILKFFSVSDAVWYDRLAGRELEPFLHKHRHLSWKRSRIYMQNKNNPSSHRKSIYI